MSVLACLAALCGVAAASGHAASGPAGTPSASPPGSQRLSDERMVTRWALPQRRATVFSRPTGRARKITHLRMLTEDGFPELYLVLSRWVDPRGAAWFRIRLPMRPNGQKGWVPEDALGALNVVHTMIDIDKRRLRLTLFDHGRPVFGARVGIGKPATPTPAGHFWIREKFRVHCVPLYGTRAIGTSAYAPSLSEWPGGGVVGLHGTNQPQLIPGRPSHGCIRLKNRDIARLYRLAPRGTPVHIH